MAHPCIYCSSDCYCNGSVDDIIVDKTPTCCQGCGCDSFDEDHGWDDDDCDDDEFEPCSRCDGHPACEDHGCAFKLALGKLVNRDLSSDNL